MNKKHISLVASFFLATQLHANDDLSSIYVTSATKSKQSIQDVTSKVNVITKEELEEKHINTLQDALNLVSGFNYTTNGGIGSTTTLMLRGTSNNRVLLLIDGIRYKDHSSTNGTNISHIMVNDIERIEIVKGAQSGIWGADAAAGVINIITKEAKSGLSGSGSMEVGSHDTQKYGLSVSNKTNKYDIKLSANKIKTDSFSSRLPKGEDVDKYEDDPYENTTVNIKLGYNFTDDSRINFNYRNIDAKKDYDTTADANDATMKSIINNDLYSLTYTHKLEKHLVTIKFDQSEFDREEEGTTTATYVYETHGTNKSIELKDRFDYVEKGFIVAGLGATKEKMNYIKVNGSSDNMESKGQFLFATNSNTFDKLILTQSLRYDKYKNFDNKTTGKLGAKYNFNSDTSFFSNYGTAYTVPLLVQNLNPWGATNTNIQPEETKSFDMGFNYKGFTATAFYNKVDNLIVWGSIPWPNTEYENIDGRSRFKGIELEYVKNITDNTLWTMNYTRTSAKNSSGENLKRVPTQVLKTSLDYYGLAKTHININAQYTGERYNDNNNAGEQTGRYTLWNGVINYDLSHSSSLFVKINNITDKIYQTVEDYATERRSFYAGVKVNF